MSTAVIFSMVVAAIIIGLALIYRWRSYRSKTSEAHTDQNPLTEIPNTVSRIVPTVVSEVGPNRIGRVAFGRVTCDAYSRDKVTVYPKGTKVRIFVSVFPTTAYVVAEMYTPDSAKDA